MMHVVLGFLAVLAVVGCGDASNERDDNVVIKEKVSDEIDPKAAMLVPSRESLPHCVPEGEGRLMYVRSENQFVVCENAAWAPIDLKGDKGDGGIGRIASQIICYGKLDPRGLSISYKATFFSSGDALVTAQLRAFEQSYAAAEIYAGSAPLSKTGEIWIGLDTEGSDSFGGYRVRILSFAPVSVEVHYDDSDEASEATWKIEQSSSCAMYEFTE